MELIISRKDDTVVTEYAYSELKRYLHQIDPSVMIQGRISDIANQQNGILLLVNNPSEEDEIDIGIENGTGVISGSNERALLIAVYKLLFSLGCRWIRPGSDGEVIPRKKLSLKDFTLKIKHKAAYRHRAVCIEGAVSYEHVYNIIDWLPKVGMSGYFFQFMDPTFFFRRWYDADKGEDFPVQSISAEDGAAFYRSLKKEIKKRGLLYHAVGHSWTCEPFHIHGDGWNTGKQTISPDITKYFAQINGERKLWYGIPMNTNLCYSNPDVREIMTSSITSYCQKNPEVDYLHLWLADGSNNHCECDDCSQKRPSDWYVLLLNELDEKLTVAALKTKVVFLIYVDLLWQPVEYRIENQDRFILMFAPITRTYSKGFTDFDREESFTIPPYVRNKLTLPFSVSENIAYLEKWQEMFTGDSFDFDYHLYDDHFRDPGYYKCAEILFKDMQNLKDIGLNGMVSCQLQRAAFPTGLPMYAMAAALWDRESTFGSIAEEYFTVSFGEKGKDVKTYLKTLSELFNPPYLRKEPTDIPKQKEALDRIPEYVARFKSDFIKPAIDDCNLLPAVHASWNYLNYHADYCTLFAQALFSAAAGEQNAVKEKANELDTFLRQNEPVLHRVLDVMYCRMVTKYCIEATTTQ